MADDLTNASSPEVFYDWVFTQDQARPSELPVHDEAPPRQLPTITVLSLPHSAGALQAVAGPAKSSTGLALSVAQPLKRPASPTGLQVPHAKRLKPGVQQSIRDYTVRKRPDVPGNKVYELGDQQELVVTNIMVGKNVFLTGLAGSGKSYTLRIAMQRLLDCAATGDEIAITATTGIAAANNGGVTLHSWSGMDIDREKTPEQHYHRIKYRLGMLERYRNTRVLIIDEIGMKEGDEFDKFNKLCQLMRGNKTPFGGIQIVACGDFFQLPPVCKAGEGFKYLFESESWLCFDLRFNLTEVFRQRELGFQTLLNEVRIGKLSKRSANLLRKMSRTLKGNEGVPMPALYARRDAVDKDNWARVRTLKGESRFYDAHDQLYDQPSTRTSYASSMIAPECLELRVNAQVMYIKNSPDGALVNGSIGLVVGFRSTSDPEVYHVYRRKDALQKQVYPVVRFPIRDTKECYEVLVTPETWKMQVGTKTMFSRVQVPLILAWALSIHKAQGQTMPLVKVVMKDMFADGQAYVALSRGTSIRGMQVMHFEWEAIKVSKRVKTWAANMKWDTGRAAEKVGEVSIAPAQSSEREQESGQVIGVV